VSSKPNVDIRIEPTTLIIISIIW